MAHTVDVDYVVIGAGATGLAFADSLIAESDASVLMVDRRHSPGGHWTDAYPFVRLHQPSAFYGVGSRRLGDDRIDETGPNAGYYERATAPEICAYFQAVVAETLIPSGQVEVLMGHDVVEDGGRVAAVSRLTGATSEVNVRRKIVDARYLESSIPATHTLPFAVDAGVRLIPVNDLVRADHPADGFTIIGAGKTGMDACCWLLDNGVDANDITWVRPRDSWVVDRGALQPLDKIGDFIKGWAASTEAAATARAVPDLIGKLEDAESLHRLDRAVEPSMLRGAILSARERDQLRTVERVIRAGRVRRIQTDRMVLDKEEVPGSPDRLYVDCSAEGLPNRRPRPVFEPGRITIQPVREGSPPFNAALIAYLEATRDDFDELNALTPPNPYPSTTQDWVRVRHVGMVAQRRWDHVDDVRDWIDRSRLNIAKGLIDHAGEPGIGEAIGKYIEHGDGAIANLAKLRLELGDQVPVDLAPPA